MQRFVVVLTLVVGLAGCEAGMQLQSLGPTQSTLDRGRGARVPAMTVRAAVWRGSPARLAGRVTPLAVTIRNDTGTPIRVSFADFSLFDERGNRYAVVSPFLLTTAQREAPRAALEPEFELRLVKYPVAPNLEERQLEQRLRFSAGMAAPYGVYPSGGVPPAYAPLRAPHHRFEPRRRFLLSVRDQSMPEAAGLRGAAVGTPPGYDALVVSWSTVLPDQPVPTAVLASALPEGVIRPGGEVQGFLYFENATLRANVIQLVWNVHSADDGAVVGTMTSSFRVMGR